MNRKYIIFGLIILLITSIIYMKFSSKNENYENILYEDIENKGELKEDEEEIDETIKIHISGEVNNPGLVELNVGSRIADAIDLVGGTTEFADISKVNLAYILSDGEKIYIPNINDKNIEEETNFTGNLKVNINTASIEQLQTLDGIGESTAEAIISYREENGRFLNIEDIKNVSGIGESKYEKIKENISVK